MASDALARQHPGRIVIEDQIAGGRRALTAKEAPEEILFTLVEGTRYPVTRIVLAGSGTQRAVSLYGEEDQLLARVVGRLPLDPSG